MIIGGPGSGKTNVLLNLIKINYQILIKFTYMSKIQRKSRDIKTKNSEVIH